jgi:hypothetical protein
MITTLRVMAAVILLFMSLFVNTVSARRTTAQAGAALFQESCFSFEISTGTAGVALASTSSCTASLSPYWMIPASLDTSGAKTVQLTVKQTAANQLQCTLIEYNRSGAILQEIGFDPFPATGAYVTASKNITIATGNNLATICAFNAQVAGIGNARVLSIEY